MVPISVSQVLTVAEPQPGQVGSVLTCLMDVFLQAPAGPQYLRTHLCGPWAIQERFWSQGLLGCDGLQSEVFSSAHLCVLTAMPVSELSVGTCLAACKDMFFAAQHQVVCLLKAPLGTGCLRCRGTV